MSAMTLDAPETVVVTERRIACDGGPNPALGHPRVFFTIPDEGFIDCNYCDRRFVLKGGPADTPEAAQGGRETGNTA